MERIATDTFSFADIREGGFVYVDKTATLKRLADGSAGKQFFIARPRRFGKSLTVSTLRCLFEGRRGLFAGLAIEPDWDWSRVYPVVHLDLGTVSADTPAELKRALVDLACAEGMRLGVTLDASLDPASVFRNLVTGAARRGADGRCVVLIDEYDKPLLNHLGAADVARYQQILKPFYGVVKYTEGVQRFALMTGVSKFSKVSVFSDLNNLNDLSMDAQAATLFGYTHAEVERCFPDALGALGAKWGLDGAGTFAELAKWYDGYRFHPDANPVFNPVSVGKCLASGEMKPYWFETGTPTFLIDLMAENPVDLSDVEIPETMFSVYEPSRPALLPLLYQTGYLTIKGYHREGCDCIYRLAMPNLEVSKAFSESLSLAFSHLDGIEHTSLLTQMVAALRRDDVNGMLDALSCFFANIPANITVRREKYYQSLFYAVFVLIGTRVSAECWTNRGRVDAVVETARVIYVFEFKLGDSGPRTLSLAAQALAQIREKGYAEKYRCRGKKVTLVGVAFDASMRNLADRAMC